MAYLIKLPAVGADSTGGSLVQWLKKEGDAVASGEAIAEIETDKAIVELNAQAAGVLAKIVVPASNAALLVNTVLGVVLADGESADEIPQALASAGMPAQENLAPAVSQNKDALAVAAPSSSASVEAAAQGEESSTRSFASPLARRIAAERGITLAGIAGSGPRGRILRRDVERAAANAPQRPVVAAGAFSAAPVEAGQTRTAHSNMRRAIARRLTESKQSVPHFYLTLECRMDALLALRAQVKQHAHTKVSVNDFIVRAAALALVEVPEVNVSWEDDALVQYARADIAVAVATPGGLVTPIVRGAEQKTLAAVAAETSELAARAREHRLKPEEFTGGSMTVSNLGMYGITQFAAIINPPQASILAVGAAEKRAVVDDDGTLSVATVMTVTLSADHRAVDGAVAAQWLAAFKKLIESPVRILL